MKKRWRDRNYKRFFIRLTWAVSMIVFGIAVIGYYIMLRDEGWNQPGSFLFSVCAAFFFLRGVCVGTLWGRLASVAGGEMDLSRFR